MTDYIDRIYKKPTEWLEWRRAHVTASDARIIMSGDDSEVMRLFEEKLGEVEPLDLSGSIPVLIGTVTEELNLCLFERATGLFISRYGQQIESKTKPFMGCTLDGFVSSENAVVEAKHSNTFTQWNDLVARYFPQIQHQMFVSGASHAYLSVLLGNAEHRIEKIEYDPFYAAALVEAEEIFWKAVQDGTPPRHIKPIEVVTGEPNRVVDFNGNNLWADNAVNWLDNRAGATKFDTAAKALKAMVEADVVLAFGHGISISRSKRGLSIKQGKDEQK